MGDIKSGLYIAGAGIKVQSERLRVIAENIANSETTASKPGGTPYQRKTIHFKNELDKELGVNVVKVDKIGLDRSPFLKVYNPGHPAADAEGYVLKPNVDPVVESADLKEAQRTYEANLGVIEVTKSMLNRTLDLLR